jgi:hypothetical protein
MTIFPVHFTAFFVGITVERLSHVVQPLLLAVHLVFSLHSRLLAVFPLLLTVQYTALIKKKRKFSSYIRKLSCICKVIYEKGLPNI